MQQTFGFIREEQQLGLPINFCSDANEPKTSGLLTTEQWAERLAEDRHENERNYRR